MNDDQFTDVSTFGVPKFVYTRSLVKACKVTQQIFFEIKLCICVTILKFINKKTLTRCCSAATWREH